MAEQEPTRELDRVFQALSDPTRRNLIERLTHGPTSVSALAEPLAMSLTAVMRHLGVLEACGLIHSQKCGRVRTCRVEPSTLRLAEHWLAHRRAACESRVPGAGECRP